MKILKTMKTRREETIESSTFDYILLLRCCCCQSSSSSSSSSSEENFVSRTFLKKQKKVIQKSIFSPPHKKYAQKISKELLFRTKKRIDR